MAVQFCHRAVGYLALQITLSAAFSLLANANILPMYCRLQVSVDVCNSLDRYCQLICVVMLMQFSLKIAAGNPNIKPYFVF